MVGFLEGMSRGGEGGHEIKTFCQETFFFILFTQRSCVFASNNLLRSFLMLGSCQEGNRVHVRINLSGLTREDSVA